MTSPRGSMPIYRFTFIVILCVALSTQVLSAQTRTAQTVPANSTLAGGAVDEGKAPKLEHFDPNLVDKSLDPCNDFYKYACNKWIAANPIPADQVYWTSGSNLQLWNENLLRETLEAATSNASNRDALHQKIGDYYAACMDEARADAEGTKPIAPMLASIDAIETPADLQRAIRRLQGLLVTAPFALVSQPDQHEPSRTIAEMAADGLGLPDRDYYLKPEPRFADAREKYQAHVQRMFELAGIRDGAQAAETVFAFEKRLAEASLDNVALRDPTNLDHPTTFAQLQAMTPHFDWVAFYDEAKLPKGDVVFFLLDTVPQLE